MATALFACFCALATVVLLRTRYRKATVEAALIAGFLGGSVGATLATIGSRAIGKRGASREVRTLEIDASAFHKHWQFKYPELHISERGTGDESPVLVLPTDTPIHLHLTAIGIRRNFRLRTPHLTIVKQVEPGRPTFVNFEVSDAGYYPSGRRCGFYCADRERTYAVNAVEPAQFTAWTRAHPTD